MEELVAMAYTCEKATKTHVEQFITIWKTSMVQHKKDSTVYCHLILLIRIGLMAELSPEASRHCQK